MLFFKQWTVNGELRIGFFSKRPIAANEELTFDYQFQKVGKIQQKCYCGSEKCRGYLGVSTNNTTTSSNQQQSSGGAFDHIWDEVSDEEDNDDDDEGDESDEDKSSSLEKIVRKGKDKESQKQKRKSSNKEDFEVKIFIESI